jgi:adenylate cyclase
MAFWGAPLNDADHAINAVTASLGMQEALSNLNTILIAEKVQPLQIGIGINTGLMNVGDMGSKFRRAYTVIGDAVNLASRLEGQTKYYHIGILVGETTYAQTKNRFIYRKIDKIKVKGKEKVVEI